MVTRGSLHRNDYTSISAPTGPGQVERITILPYDTKIDTFTANTIYLYIDDQEIFADGIYAIGSIWLPIANVVVEGSNILHLAEDPGFDFAYPEGVRIYIDNLSDKTRNLWLMITGYEYKEV